MFAGIILLFLIVVTNLSAMGDDRAVRHITADDGLSSNAIYSITQDSLGRMWFGTNDGLHSYDGNKVRVWRDPDMKSLGQVVYAIQEDHEGKLWIGTESGLILFDLRKERFASAPFEKNGFRILSPVTSVLVDSKGRIWIATNGQGIIRYNPADLSTRHYAAGGKMNSDRISVLTEDRKGKIWGAGFDKGLCGYDENKDIFLPVEATPSAILSLHEDSMGHFWVGTENGLRHYDRDTGTWSQISIPHSSNVFQIRRIIEYAPGMLLLASDEGLTSYNVETKESTTYTGSPGRSDDLNDKHLHALFLDKDNGLWIGSYFGGVNYVSAYSQPFHNLNQENSGLKGRTISVFAKGEGGKVWIGSDDAGVSLWDRDAGTFRTLHDVTGTTSSYHNVHSLLQAGGKLFIGMYMGGLDIIDLHGRTLRNHKGGSGPNSLYSSSIYCIYRDKRDNIWIGTTRGLNRYIPADDSFERIFDLNRTNVEHIFEDSRGFLYACSPHNGIFRLDPTSGKWVHFSQENGKMKGSEGLTTDKIVTGAEDGLGRIWFGTDGNGLFRFYPDTGRFEHQSLPEEVRVINRIMPSGDRLWLTTSHGLYCYTPGNGHLLSFSKASGLRNNQFMPNSGLILSDSTMLAGGVDGFDEFHPADFNMDPVNPKVIISDMELFNRPVAVGTPGSPLKEAIAYSDALVLKHTHSIFSLTVAVPDYDNTTGNRFIYKLEGFDPDWNMGPSDGRVSYTNLPAGNYCFKVRAADGIGGWNEDSLSLPIKVLPPWWWSVPMIILYLVIFFLILYLLYRRILRKQEEKLQLMTAQKDKELYQSKIDFFTHMVHEIRTPLTLILTPLENVMKSKGTLEEQKATLDVMHRNGHRLLNLVNRLMDFRKMESGCMKLDLKPIDLTGVIGEIRQNFLPGAKAKGVTVQCFLPSSPVIVRGDIEALHHVIDNLLSNALKFTSTHIWIEMAPAEEGTVRITVKDNGRGIPEDELDKIFSPFYQVESTRPQDEIGTGIGLLLVKKYVDMMNGRIAVESRPGMGAEFSVWLNESVSEETKEVADKEELSVAPETDTPEDDEGKERLLIVEDNTDLLDFLTQLFAKDYDVRRASDGEEALNILKDFPASIVISDVMMPKIDGMELCRRIKSDIATSHIPVVLLTAKVETSDFVEGFEKGADLYVSKPFSAELLKAQVAGILANRRRLRQKFGSQPLAKATELVPNSILDNEWLNKIKDIVMANLENPDFTVDALAKEIGISRTGLFGKLKAVAAMTPNAYIKLIRLKEAARLLSEEGCRVSEACYRVGFASRSHFAKYFQEQFGVSPNDYHG